MTATERRASASLASIFALRMLGLFLVVPVFALEAAKYPGGGDAARVGLALGIYGLTQALLQIPFGLASDRLGRKKVIVAGLLVFAAGSFLAAAAPTLDWLMAGRALQGAGAVSAAVTALLADLTRDEVRTKAMALVGGSIGLMFALSLMLSPALNALVGITGLFALTGVLALGAIGLLVWTVPAEPPAHVNAAGVALFQALKSRELLGLNLGVLVLNAIQLSMWLVVPGLLVQAGLLKAQHWQVYLPAVLGSFVVMGATLFPLERKGHLRAALLGYIVLLAFVELGFLAVGSGTVATPSVLVLGTLLLIFFCSFNVLEASLPSLVSRLAPASNRGAAIGLYNTSQSLGLFAGGAFGGIVVKWSGPTGLFVSTTALSLLWLVVAWRLMPAVGRKS
jgi:MFS family permease